MQIESANERLAPVAQSVSASYLYVSSDKEMRRSGVRASPGAKVLVQRENSKSRHDSTRRFQSAKLIPKSHLITVYCHGN